MFRFLASAVFAIALALVAAPLGVLSEIVETGSVPCDFPNEPQFLEPPECAPTTLSLANATALAWQYAPEIRFHNLEDSPMLNPSEYFNQASLFAPKFVFTNPDPACDSQANITCEVKQEWRNLSTVWEEDRTTAMFLHRSWLSILLSTALSQAEKDFVMAGSPFVQGVSTATMPVTIFPAQAGNAWVMTFHQFYAFNGCSNQALSTRFGREYDVLQYYMCPDGIHEGDWEHIGLYICPADLEGANGSIRKSIHRIHYSQHAWIQEYDCKKEQCPFEDDANSRSKLVSYSGLFSHANYPSASSLWVYSQTQLGFLQNLDGLYVADRTEGTATKGRRFVPTRQNIRYIPPVDQIADDSPDQWALYPGNWGAGDLFLDSKRRLVCYYDNFTRTGECDTELQSFQLLEGILSAETVANTSQATQQASEESLAEFSNRVLEAAHRTGPLQRDYSYTWLEEKSAPIYDKLTDANDTTALLRTELTCPASKEISSIEAFTEEFKGNSVLPAIIGILVGAAALGLAVGILLLLSARFSHGTPAHNLLSEKLRRLVVSDHVSDVKELPEFLQERCSEYESKLTISGWIAPVISIILFLLGIILVSITLSDFFEALDDAYPWSAWDGFMSLVVTLLAWGVIVDICLVILLTRANPADRKFSKWCCCCIPWRQSSLKQALQQHIAWNSVFAFIVALQLTLTVTLFAIGFLLLIARSLLSEGCKQVQGLVNDVFESTTELGAVCLDLSPFGLNSVTCGGEVVRFCNNWSGVRASFMLWGCYCILMSQLLLLQLLYQRGHTLGLLLGLENLEHSLQHDSSEHAGEKREQSASIGLAPSGKDPGAAFQTSLHGKAEAAGSNISEQADTANDKES